MNCLPVILRELLVGGRRPGTYRHRLIVAAVAIGVMALLFMFHRPYTPTADLGQRLFVSVGVLGFAYAFLAGVFLTTDCICSERRAGTLPLLFLTRLSGFDVALSKLASTSLVSSYALLAILPMLGLPLVLGGVTGGEFARICLALVMTLVYSLMSGLLCSTVCRDTRSSMGLAFAILLILTGLFYAPFWTLKALSPIGAFANGFDASYRLPAGVQRYWIPIFSMACLTLVQFTATGLLMRRIQLPSEGKVRSPRLTGSNRHRLQGNAYEWLLLRDHFPSRGVWLVCFSIAAVCGGCLLSGLATANRRLAIPLFFTAVIAVFALHVLFKLLIITQASRRLVEDRQSGALELLLVTPLAPREILDAHRRALWFQFRGLIGLLLCVNLDLAATVLFWHQQTLPRPYDAFAYCFCFFGGAMLLLVDFFLIPWLAIAEVFRSKPQHLTVLCAVMRGLAPSWLGQLGLIFVGFGTYMDGDIVFSLFWLWAIGSTVYMLAMALCREFELRRFRALAAGDDYRREPTPSARPALLQAEIPPALARIVEG